MLRTIELLTGRVQSKTATLDMAADQVHSWLQVKENDHTYNDLYQEISSLIGETHTILKLLNLIEKKIEKELLNEN